MAMRSGWDDEGDHGRWIPRTPSMSLPIDDEIVKWAIGCVMVMDVVGKLKDWKEAERKGLGGRPQSLPLHAVLVAMTTAALLGAPMLATAFCDILFVRISPAMRSELGVPDPPGQLDVRGWNACYRNVRTRLHVDLLRFVDPSDTPKNRRYSHSEFERILEENKSRRTDADRLVCDERLTWLCNRILEASLQHLPREFRRRWKKGSLAVDATPVRAFSRKPRQVAGKVWGNRLEQVCHVADPDAGFYQRTRTTSNDTGEALGPTKFGRAAQSDWAFELALAVSVADHPDDLMRNPTLVFGMARLCVPGVEPGQNAIRALQDIAGRGYPTTGYLICDRAYPNSKPENFQLPARSLGYEPVFDYRVDQLGIQAEARGLIQVEGGWYSPSLPDNLISATLDFREGRIPEETYDARIEERRRYRARPKGKPDADGYQRYMCPASDGCLAARCENKPESMRSPKSVPLRIELKPDLRSNPPKICTQQSVMIGPEVGAKFAQSLHYGSPEWKAAYGQRNAVEGMNGYVKDGAHEALADPMRRRIRGVAAQSVLSAFILFAANIRKIDAFLKTEAAIEAGAVTRLIRRREGRSLQDFRPGSGFGNGPAQPAPD